MKRFLVSAILCLSLAGVSGLEAYTFSLTPPTTDPNNIPGLVQHWNTNQFPLLYYINSGGYSNINISDIENTIKASFTAWQNNPLCAITFKYGNQTPISTVMNDGRNIIIFSSRVTGLDFDGTYGPATIGITVRSYYASDGSIPDADIIFNEDYTFSSTATTDISKKLINLQDVATHEIGHLLGLNHTYLEQATMWPYAADGQKTLKNDDKDGAGALYPSPTFTSTTDSITGTVRDSDGNPVFGVFVSAIPDGSTAEDVGVISLAGGHYSIRGLPLGGTFRLHARSVDLGHLGGPGSYEQTNGTTQVFIPQYYSDATVLDSARAVSTHSGGIDFNMSVATILARYNQGYTDYYFINFPGTGGNTTTSDYFAIRFPAADLPASFTAYKVFGMEFWNNDMDMFWPRIMLCDDLNGKPNLTNVLRQVINYQGKEQAFSLVEWDTITLTKTKDIWVVFQFPLSSSTTLGSGPAIGGELNAKGFNSFFYSSDGGSSYSPFPRDVNGNYFNALVKLTVGPSNAPIPAAQLDSASIDFGVTKVNQTAVYRLPVKNLGTGDLVISNQFSPSNPAFGASMKNYTVPAGGADTIFVSFLPKVSYGNFTAQIIVVTNDPAHTSFKVNLKGRGAYPKAQLSATALDFGAIDPGAAASRSVTLKNSGLVSLSAWGFGVQGGPFSTTLRDTLRIAAGDSSIFTVYFTPTAAGQFTGAFGFSVDDSLKTTYSVNLSGTGAGTVVVKSCDFSGDGRATLIDVMAFILLSRANPSSPLLDWNGDGAFSLADVLALLRDIRTGTCPSTLLAASGGPDDEHWLAALGREDIAYLKKMLAGLEFPAQDREALETLLAGMAAPAELPRAFALAQNYPNPFNPRTAIVFSVPEGGGGEKISLVIFDIRGKLVRTLVEGARDPGEHTVFWLGEDDSGRALPSGIYFYRLRAGGQVLTRKMVLLK